jgi:predicted nuclease with TOPRIM domain
VSAVPHPVDPRQPQALQPAGVPAISAAADRARAQLHEEIERVRAGVEEMMAEQGGIEDAELRRELDDLREETRLYVKKRLGKSERKIEKSVQRIDDRTRRLEKRIDQVEEDRERAEWRIHTDTESMLDGLLAEIREIADRLDGNARRQQPPLYPQA